MVLVDEGVPEMMVFAWVDRDRRYFIATIGSLEEGQVVLRHIWSQVVENMNSYNQMVYLNIPIPVSEDMYYATRSDFDKNNQRRCDDIKLEKRLGTHIWYLSVNMSIFVVSVVDTYNVATKSLAYEETYNLFLYDLAEDKIDKDLYSRPIRPPSKITGGSASPLPVKKGVTAHIF